MTGGAFRRRPLYLRAARRASQAIRNLQRRVGRFRKARANPAARIGIYVAYFDASWIFEDHLRCIRDLSAGPFNYYVMGNCTSAAERDWFDATLAKFGFPVAFRPWPASMPLSHGESLQRLIEETDDEIIVLLDVDAFPIRHGWDDHVVSELSRKDVVGAVVDFPDRAMAVVLHPSFIAFRRSLLANNGLDVLPGEDNDPAYKITRYLQAMGRLTPEHVDALFPTRRAITVYPEGHNELFGRRDLVHGFGTTYADLVFHFWFGRHVATRQEPLDRRGVPVVTLAEMDRVVDDTRRWVRDLCGRHGRAETAS